MAATLTSATVKASISWQYDKAVTGLTNSLTNQNTVSYSTTLTNGTGAAGTADLLYFAQAAIAASSTASYDLAGSLSDVFGATITMARVKFMYFNVTTDTTGSSVALGNDANPLANWISDATKTVKVLNGGVFLLGAPGATGYPVTATTGDVLKITNNDSSNVATVNSVFIGSSA